MIVMKFGGSSLSTPDRVKNVCSIVTKARREQGAVAVVCSAFGGATDQLIDMGQKATQRDLAYKTLLTAFKNRHRDAVRVLVGHGRQPELLPQVEKMMEDLGDVLHGVYLIREASARTMDYIMGFGERLSSLIVSYALKTTLTDDVSYLDARSVVKTDDQFGKAQVQLEVTEKLIIEHFAKHDELQVVTGYIGSSTDSNHTTTLGRGGSDYTVSLFGAALECREIQVWTDVSGVLTADPRKVKQAFSIPGITYEEAMEMSHFGAKVIYPPTMAPAMKAGIPIVIKNTFEPEHKGTRISTDLNHEPQLISGISSIDRVALLQLKGSGMIGVEGTASRLFGALAQQDVNVILISQASSEHSICVAVAPSDAARAKKAVDDCFSYEILMGRIDPLQIEKNLSVIAVVGAGMCRRPGISGLIFNALGANAINVVAIAQGSSELNVSFIVKEDDETRALNVLHNAFFTTDETASHVFLVGPGLIGAELIRQIKAQNEILARDYNRRLILGGVANSRKMVFSRDGLDLDHYARVLEASETTMDPQAFLQAIHDMKPRRAILVDCTSNEAITQLYEPALKAGISIATPNKKANTGSWERFCELKELAAGKDVSFLYESNAGAGLPVIGTLKNLIATGDRVLRIEAMLSGTLSYLFNTFNEETPFSEAVRIARDKGFTEPDPRDDLSGTDVARKLLLLARECGHALELKDLEVESLVPNSCQSAGSVDAFMEALPTGDDQFQKRLQEAQAQGKALRYIAEFDGRVGRIALKAVGPEHPCFQVAACDNIVAFTTQRYRETPLVIKGPGAGAAVTAAQVFAEIIQIAGN